MFCAYIYTYTYTNIHVYIYIYTLFLYVLIVVLCFLTCCYMLLIFASLSTTNLNTFGNHSTTRGYTSQERLRCTQVARLIGMGLFSCLLGVTSFTVVCHHDLFVHDLPLQQILNEISVRLSSSCEDFGSHLC